MSTIRAVQLIRTAGLSHLDTSDVVELSRTLDAQRGTAEWDAEGSPIVAMALRGELRDRYRREWSRRSVGDRIEYVRTMPNYMPQMWMQARSDAVQTLLEEQFGFELVDTALDEYDRNADPEGEGWPAFLAARYEAALVDIDTEGK